MSNLNRRDFMRVAGAASATAAVGCNDMALLIEPRTPIENVLPYVVQPDQLIPGMPTYFATACNECSASCGVLARNREGRIVKVEGNPDHPLNQGRLCSVGLQSILSTYGPDRFASPMSGGAPTTWDAIVPEIGAAVKAAVAGGKKVAWLGYPRTGAADAIVQQVVSAAGGTVVLWDPLGDDALRAATKAVFGRNEVPTFTLDDAHTVVSFGADFVSDVALAHGWANSRDPGHGGFVSRTVCVQPDLGRSSSMSDVLLKPVPGTEAGVAMALAKLVADKKHYNGPATALLSGVDAAAAATAGGIDLARLTEVAGWIAAASSVALPGGPTTSAAATDLAIATLLLNEVAGNIGHSVHFGGTQNVTNASSYSDVVALLAACKAGEVGVLFMDDLDPVHALPPGAGAAEALAAVGKLVAFANEPSDSLAASAIVLPPGSTLETWGANEAQHGWYTLQQPGMKPLHDTRAVGDSLLAIAKAAGLKSPVTAVAADVAPATREGAKKLQAGQKVAIGAPAVRPGDAEPAPEVIPVPGLDAAGWQAYLGQWWKAVVWDRAGRPGTFDKFWVDSLHSGGWFAKVKPVGASVTMTVAPTHAPATPEGDGLVLALFPHPFIVDGRHANKPWAQEVPDPLTAYTWGTWAVVSPATAEKLGLDPDGTVKVTTEHGDIECGWFGNPGVRDDVVAIVMGNGKEKSGRYTAFGANPTKLIGAAADEKSGALPYVSTRAKVTKASGKNLYSLLGTTHMHDRGVNFAVSIEDFNDKSKHDGPASIVPAHHVPVDQRLIDAGLTDMYPEPEHPTYRFAMAVDLNRCTGCGACETACFGENNTPIVGPDEHRLGRHMGWIRLSRYFEGEGDTPDVRFQLNICQHCSHAPCEGVCPVLATYHNLDGLNAMLYNRCVGTRYCANNCPYTSRRFNYHSYKWPESFNLMLNPDVSTREMGVMEKCTFCVHRLREIKDTFRDNRYNGSGGPVVATDEALRRATACAQACPTDAITFGNAKDPKAEVSLKFQEPRAYAMLVELNDKPGVRYLARINHTASKLHHGGGHADAGEHGEDKGHAKPGAEHGAESGHH
jgi:Fe-S-cluster-containing dehydrogenase component/anaerobic selenocysteine-containing dehydrogenase